MKTDAMTNIAPVAVANDGGRGTATEAAAPAAPPTRSLVVPASPASTPPEPIVRETLEAVARDIQDYLKRNGRNLEFNVDESTGRMVISVRDAATGELIRQIPGEEALAMSQ